MPQGPIRPPFDEFQRDTQAPAVAPSPPTGGASSFGLPVRSLYEDLTPGLAYLKDEVARIYNTKSMREWAFNPENLSKTTGELDQEKMMEGMIPSLMQMTEEGAGLDDNEWQQAQDAALANLGGPPGMPADPTLEDPNHLQLGVSMLAGLLDPKHAFESGAAPYGHQLAERERAREMALNGWKGGLEGYKAKAGLTSDMLSETNRRQIAGAEMASRERIAEGKTDSAEVKALKDRLFNERTDVKAIPGLLIDLARHGVMYPESVTKALMNKGYVQGKSESGVAVDSQKILESKARVSHYGKLDEKIDKEIDVLTEKKGLVAWQKQQVRARTIWFPKEKQKAFALIEARIQRMKDQTAIEKDGLVFKYDALDVNSQLRARSIYLDSLQTQVNSLDEQHGDLMRQGQDLLQQIADDKFLNDGALSEEGSQLLKEYNGLRDLLKVDGPIDKAMKDYKSQLELIEKHPPKAQNRPTGSGAAQQPDGEFKMGSDGVMRRVQTSAGPPSRGGGGTRARRGGHGANIALGAKIAKEEGWEGDEWKALRELWNHESGWNHNAQNPTSSAHGIAQFLDSTYKNYGGKSSDPEKQIRAGIKYIKDRYGSPSKALAHWKKRVPIDGKDKGNWY